jgi:recombinational DNA repair protein (RecF pathway)
MEEKTTGLLLQTIPYLKGQRILKILTPEQGLVTLLAYQKIPPALATPFVWAEWVYTSSNRPMHSLKEGTLLDDLRALKENFARLSVAGQIASDLLKTQMPGKSASEPLTLALACLRKLSIFEEPRVLGAAFRLKLLYAEGMLHEDDLTSSFLRTLGLSRSFQELAMLPFEEEPMRTADMLFERRFYIPPSSNV